MVQPHISDVASQGGIEDPSIEETAGVNAEATGSVTSQSAEDTVLLVQQRLNATQQTLNNCSTNGDDDNQTLNTITTGDIQAQVLLRPQAQPAVVNQKKNTEPSKSGDDADKHAIMQEKEMKATMKKRTTGDKDDTVRHPINGGSSTTDSPSLTSSSSSFNDNDPALMQRKSVVEAMVFGQHDEEQQGQGAGGDAAAARHGGNNQSQVEQTELRRATIRAAASRPGAYNIDGPGGGDGGSGNTIDDGNTTVGNADVDTPSPVFDAHMAEDAEQAIRDRVRERVEQQRNNRTVKALDVRAIDADRGYPKSKEAAASSTHARFLMLLWLIAATTIIIIVIFFFKKSGGDQITDEVMPTPVDTQTSPPTLSNKEYILSKLEGTMLNDLLQKQKLLLSDETSDQYRALDWMASDDVYSREVLLPALKLVDDQDSKDYNSTTFAAARRALRLLAERYALVVLNYATNIPASPYFDAISVPYLNSTMSVCQWGTYIGCQNSSESVFGINLGAAGLNGTIPSELMVLTGLESLYINRNYDLHGTLPPEFGNTLSNLRSVEVSSNSLSGSMPESWDNMRNMEFLSFDTNYFTGTLSPNFFKARPELYLVTGSRNALSGTIPEFGDNDSNNKMQWLHLALNQMTGTIPTSILSTAGDDSRLEHLLLYDNHFNGTLPTLIGSLSKLMGFDVEGNQLTGQIPSEIGDLHGLTSLFVNRNLFTGTFSQVELS